MKNLQNNFEKVQTAIVVICLIVMSCSSFFQVLNRNIFKIPLSWTEELSRYCMIWMTMIGTGISVRKGTQMALNVWGKKLKGIPLFVVDLFSHILVLAFCVVVAICVIQLIQVQIKSGQLSPAMHIPMYVMSLSILIGFAFMCLVEVEKIVEVVRHKGQPPVEIEMEEAK